MITCYGFIVSFLRSHPSPYDDSSSPTESLPKYSRINSSATVELIFRSFNRLF
ncbi:MAG: hypothetical protein KME25_03565 [Symplocastrum torsivum CPER-KK1]|uniref:Uncharacterized protein n=1 Tax=Symplocastrum torsivum CPER-KK1 TaxID=450513 RepID=A0A951PHG3_9CYAN|nr:hypothetical protein [Symplocastrum torsivum CPER-KK1]